MCYQVIDTTGPSQWIGINYSDINSRPKKDHEELNLKPSYYLAAGVESIKQQRKRNGQYLYSPLNYRNYGTIKRVDNGLNNKIGNDLLHVECCVNNISLGKQFDPKEFVVGALKPNTKYKIDFELHYKNGENVTLPCHVCATLTPASICNDNLRVRTKHERQTCYTYASLQYSGINVNKPIFTMYGKMEYIEIKYPKPVFIRNIKLIAAFINQTNKLGQNWIEYFDNKKIDWKVLKFIRGVTDYEPQDSSVSQVCGVVKLTNVNIVSDTLRLVSKCGQIILKGIYII